jgi:CubicO group peptidase (beta-lactamase class C family)
MSKAFVDLIYGALLADGNLSSLDEPVVKLLPKLPDVDSRKAAMTHRHLSVRFVHGCDGERAHARGTVDVVHVRATGDHIDYFRYLTSAPGHSRYAEGWLGQYIDIVADRQLVVVRMRRPLASDDADQTVEVNAFPGIVADVVRLVRSRYPRVSSLSDSRPKQQHATPRARRVVFRRDFSTLIKLGGRILVR